MILRLRLLGSGKSGVIEAIDFGLTGQMGRLTGRGTNGLSVSEHGPHVARVKFPDAAFVKLGGFRNGRNGTY
jgi:DNA repair exonuclease SbcCD ATPase subunit